MKETGKARLNHVAIFVSDLDRSIEFYEKAFGLELPGEGGNPQPDTHPAHFE